MKKITVLVVAFLFVSMNAFAAGATQFVGLYKILAEQVGSLEDSYLLVDNDTLEAIWSRYADGDLPTEYEEYRDESVILAGFTHKDFLILTFEEFSTVTEDFLSISGADDDLLELQINNGSGARAATRSNSEITYYSLDAAVEIPSKFPGGFFQKKKLIFQY